MDPLRVSIVVASRGRAEALSLCLTALGQLQYHPFEVVVVGDAEAREAVERHPLGARLKCAACNVANIALARNVGIGLSAGEVVAFIDDDAIPEPDWLGHLVQPLADPATDGAGGFVVGRNGFSLQWGARGVDAEGWHHDLIYRGEAAFVAEPGHGLAPRTEGTNMAFRRSRLLAAGGFDTAFRYFFDDTDLDMRIASDGGRIALVPRARVWHRQLASSRRTAARTPRQLYDIGASTAAFLSRHAAPDRFVPALAAHRAVQRARLLRHMVNGQLVPGDVGRLLREFDSGVEEGSVRGPRLQSDFPSPPPFMPLQDKPPEAPRHILQGWAWQTRGLMEEARRRVEAGALVHVVRLTPTGLYHHRRYVAPGLWLQTGGVFGRSDRSGPLLRIVRAKARMREEAARGPLSRPVPIPCGN